MTPTQLVEEINSLPPNLREQALNFIAFQKLQAQKQLPSQKLPFDTSEKPTATPDDLYKPLGIL